MSLISCENLAFAYEGVTVLRGLNFQVEQGFWHLQDCGEQRRMRCFRNIMPTRCI